MRTKRHFDLHVNMVNKCMNLYEIYDDHAVNVNLIANYGLPMHKGRLIDFLCSLGLTDCSQRFSKSHHFCFENSDGVEKMLYIHMPIRIPSLYIADGQTVIYDSEGSVLKEYKFFSFLDCLKEVLAQIMNTELNVTVVS